MNVKQAIETRRAYRSFDKMTVDDETVSQLAEAAKLAPSCFNNQPWRFVFVRDSSQLFAMRQALSKGNEWIYEASMIVAVVTSKELDCAMKDGREYYLFDTGMACAFLILRATELGLVAHPVAGYDEAAVKSILGVPDELRLVTLINVGKHSATVNPNLSEKQKNDEKARPSRKDNAEFAFKDRYNKI